MSVPRLRIRWSEDRDSENRESEGRGTASLEVSAAPEDADGYSLPERPLPAFARLPVLLLVAAVFCVLLITSDHFLYKGDELYYIVTGRYLAWGYPDQPPLIPLLAHLAQSAFPGSQLALRLPATIAVPLAVLVTALIAREFGGAGRAQLLAAATFATAPLVLSDGHFLSTTTLDLAFWTVTTWLLIRWVRTRDDRLWLAMGAVTAVALQNKYLILFFWVAIAITACAFGPRDVFRRPLAWAGAAIPALTAIPGLIWQAQHGWPQIAMGPVLASTNAGNGGRLGFVPLLMFTDAGLIGTALLFSGVWRLLRSPELRPYRFLGCTVIVLAVIFLADDQSAYYLGGMFPTCWGVAAVVVERRMTAAWWRWLATWPALAISLAVLLPGLVPVSDNWLGGADRHILALRNFNWPKLASVTDTVYRQMPAAERRSTVVLANDYGRAAALQLFGPAAGLPPVYSANRGFWYFGGPSTARNVIYAGPIPDTLERECGQLRQAVSYVDPIATQGPTRVPTLPIYVCTGLKQPWSRLWPTLRNL